MNDRNDVPPPRQRPDWYRPITGRPPAPRTRPSRPRTRWGLVVLVMVVAAWCSATLTAVYLAYRGV